MHNIDEGFDGGSNSEFVKFLRYSQRSCAEVQSQLYVALDQSYITPEQFDTIYEQAAQTHRKIGGFIRYLLRSSEPPKRQTRQTKTKNEEPRTKNQKHL